MQCINSGSAEFWPELKSEMREVEHVKKQRIQKEAVVGEIEA